MKANQIHEIVGGDQVTKSKGIFTVRWGFFYRHGMTAELFKARVEERLKKANIDYTTIEAYEHWAAFKGGASIAKQSHFAVKFIIHE